MAIDVYLKRMIDLTELEVKVLAVFETWIVTAKQMGANNAALNDRVIERIENEVMSIFSLARETYIRRSIMADVATDKKLIMAEMEAELNRVFEIWRKTAEAKVYLNIKFIDRIKDDAMAIFRKIT